MRYVLWDVLQAINFSDKVDLGNLVWRILEKLHPQKDFQGIYIYTVWWSRYLFKFCLEVKWIVLYSPCVPARWMNNKASLWRKNINRMKINILPEYLVFRFAVFFIIKLLTFRISLAFLLLETAWNVHLARTTVSSRQATACQYSLCLCAYSCKYMEITNNAPCCCSAMKNRRMPNNQIHIQSIC